MKADTPDMIKFKDLKHLLGKPAYVVVGLLEALWIATAKNAFMGDIGRHTNRQIASILEWDGDHDQLIDALVDAKWLDRVDGPARLVIHDWYGNVAQYIVQKINRKMGFTVDQLRQPGAKETAHAAWEEYVGLHNECSACVETHMQTEAESPPSRARARTLPIPSLPNPSPPIPSEPASTGVDAEWDAVADDLLSLGVGFPPSILQPVRERGCKPIDARRVISHWKAKLPAWERGGLVYRLRSLAPGQDPADVNLWPPPSKAATQADTSAERERVAGAAEGERVANAAKLRVEAEHRAALESKHGARIDVLSRPEIRDLAVECMGKTSGEFATKKLATMPLPVGSVVRDAILAHFDAQPP